MATAYLLKDVRKKPDQSLTVAAATSNAVISAEVPITKEMSNDFATTLQVTAVTLGGGEQILIKLQQFNGIGWMDVSATVAAVPVNNGIGEYFIFLDEGLCAEAFVLPLMNRIRLVVTTGATSTVTFGAIFMYRNEN